MNKREICERLMEIRDQFSAGHLGPVGIRDALRDLILDLNAQEEEKKESVCVRCGGNLLPCAKPDLLYCRKCDKVFAKEELKHEEAEATKGKRPLLIVFRKEADE